MAYRFEHRVRFDETDAAGVVYFAKELALCHAAYEASLAAAGIDIRAFFGAEELAHPIVHASMDYCRPLHCGDRTHIHLIPRQLDDSTFEIQYQVMVSDALAAKAVTRHVCIAVADRRRSPLPDPILQWLERWGAEPYQDPPNQEQS